MGAQSSQVQEFQIPITKSILAMLMRSKEEDVINVLEKRKNKNFIKQPISSNGDTLLHYAVASGRLKLIQYLLKNAPQLKVQKNKQGNLPRDLTSDNTIRNLVNN